MSSIASSPVYATATSLDDIILEEEPGGVVIDDRSGEDSDGASGTFSCNSSRCSSIRSYGRTGIGGSFSSISNRITTQEEPLLVQTGEKTLTRRELVGLAR